MGVHDASCRLGGGGLQDVVAGCRCRLPINTEALCIEVKSRR